MKNVFSLSCAVRQKAYFLLVLTVFMTIMPAVQASMRPPTTNSTLPSIKTEEFSLPVEIIPQLLSGEIQIAEDEFEKLYPVEAGTVLSALLPAPDEDDQALASNRIPILNLRKKGFIWNQLGKDTLIYKLGGENGNLHMNVHIHGIANGDAPLLTYFESKGKYYWCQSLVGSYRRSGIFAAGNHLSYVVPMSVADAADPDLALRKMRGNQDPDYALIMATEIMAGVTRGQPVSPVAAYALIAPVWGTGQTVAMTEIAVTASGVVSAATLEAVAIAFCIYGAPLVAVGVIGWLVWSHRDEITEGLRGVWKFCEYYARKHYLARLAAASAAAALTLYEVQRMRDDELVEELAERVANLDWMYDDIERMRDREPGPPNRDPNFRTKWRIFTLFMAGLALASEIEDFDLKIREAVDAGLEWATPDVQKLWEEMRQRISSRGALSKAEVAEWDDHVHELNLVLQYLYLQGRSSDPNVLRGFLQDYELYTGWVEQIQHSARVPRVEIFESLLNDLRQVMSQTLAEELLGAGTVGEWILDFARLHASKEIIDHPEFEVDFSDYRFLVGSDEQINFLIGMMTEFATTAFILTTSGLSSDMWASHSVPDYVIKIITSDEHMSVSPEDEFAVQGRALEVAQGLRESLGVDVAVPEVLAAFYDAKGRLCIVMERLNDARTVEDLKKGFGGPAMKYFTETVANQLTEDLRSFLRALHREGIAHSDLHSENIMVRIIRVGERYVFRLAVIDYGNVQLRGPRANPSWWGQQTGADWVKFTEAAKAFLKIAQNSQH